MYSYYILGVIESGEVVHHIEPLLECWDKRLSLDNLIYLTEKNHRFIHNTMKKSKEDKEYMQELLKGLLKRFFDEIK